MSASWPRLARTLAVLALALVAVFLVVCSAAVMRFTAQRPELAARFWPGHPRVQLALAMGAIGASAARGEAPAAETLAQVEDAARAAPLAIEPFLIKGASAIAAGDAARAERLFIAAKQRDPRAPAARYFLAQQYLTSGRAAEGLAEVAVLVRLVGGSPSLVAGLAQFAREPGAVAQLRPLFATNPGLGDEVLSSLARDAANADLIVALAGNDVGTRATGARPAWQAPLLAALIEKGEFARAHELWARLSGLRQPPAGLFNPQFATLSAPEPFNWILGTGDFGVAEASGQGLQVIYYGRADADFATQLLLLRPGTYALRMKVARQADAGGDSGLAWSLSCRPRGSNLLRLPLGGGAGQGEALSGRFTVPADCPAQLLKLRGAARDLAASEQVVITDLQLVRGAR